MILVLHRRSYGGLVFLVGSLIDSLQSCWKPLEPGEGHPYIEGEGPVPCTYGFRFPPLRVRLSHALMHTLEPSCYSLPIKDSKANFQGGHRILYRDCILAVGLPEILTVAAWKSYGRRYDFPDSCADPKSKSTCLQSQ